MRLLKLFSTTMMSSESAGESVPSWLWDASREGARKPEFCLTQSATAPLVITCKSCRSHRSGPSSSSGSRRRGSPSAGSNPAEKRGIKHVKEWKEGKSFPPPADSCSVLIWKLTRFAMTMVSTMTGSEAVPRVNWRPRGGCPEDTSKQCPSSKRCSSSYSAATMFSTCPDGRSYSKRKRKWKTGREARCPTSFR